MGCFQQNDLLEDEVNKQIFGGNLGDLVFSQVKPIPNNHQKSMNDTV